MSQNQDKKDVTTPETIEAAKKQLPLDTRLLSEAVIELNISRKNVGIYPPGHMQIAKSIDRAFQVLQRLFEVRSEMTLGVAKNMLLVGNDYLDPKNPVYRDFALSLNSQGIATVTFIQDLSRDELVQFHRILTTKPAEITAAGGIEKVMADSAIQHIIIIAIDYTKFQGTEEQEIFKPQTRAAVKGDAGVWQDFVSHLAAGTLAGAGQGISLKDAEQIDPAELARLLNERKLDPSMAVQSYDRIVSDHVRCAAEKKQLTSEQSRTLTNLNALLKDLNPELRKQFLSVAAHHVSAAPPTGIDEIVGGFSDDMVIDMLAQANAEGREISPTLTGLVGKLAKVRDQSQGAGNVHDRSGQPKSEMAVPDITPEQMQKLFDREKYEDHVDADYSAMLKQMTDAPVIEIGQFPIQEYEKTLEDVHLDFQIGRALIAFMEENIDEEDYEAFALKLATIVPGFLQTGNFELLFDISETLKETCLGETDGRHEGCC